MNATKQLLTIIAIVIISTTIISFFYQSNSTKELALDRIDRIGTIKVCYATYPPIVFKDPNTAEVKGENVDAIKLIAKEANWQIEYVESNWGGIVAAVQSGQCDLAIG